jgi:hypothetical protein
MTKTKLPPVGFNEKIPGDVHLGIKICAMNEGKTLKDKIIEILTMWNDKQIMINKQKK